MAPANMNIGTAKASPDRGPGFEPGGLTVLPCASAGCSAIQTGSTVSGNAVQIVIVQTDPGYAPDPGDAGTGTVVAVAVVC
jgi:hypothetical protein